MNLVALAQRIQQLRKERGLTLQELAAQTGLTRSVLSKVENFRVTPSLPALARIAEALGVTMSTLLQGLDAQPRVVVVRRDERVTIQRDAPNSKLIYAALAHPRPQKLMEPFIVEVPVGEARKERLAHEGEEFFLVLQGAVEFEYGDATYQLAEGDALYADGSVQHRLHNMGATLARVVIVFAKGNGPSGC